MPNVITKMFAPKVPTTVIAGAALTHEEATQLMYTCTALKNELNLQFGAIGQIPNTTKERAVSKLRQVQSRHSDIHNDLTLVVSKTQSSTAPWAREFGDAHAALERKIVAINRRSRELGWINVVLQCWPIVRITYEWLLPLVLRLQGELQRALRKKDLWTQGVTAQLSDEADERDKQQLVALYKTYASVHFGKEVMVQGYRIGSMIDKQSEGKPTTAALSDDRKRTAGKFKGKRAKFEVRWSDSDQ